MKHFTLLIVVVMAISTFAIAIDPQYEKNSYPAYGPDSYQAIHGIGDYASSVVERKGFRLGLGIGGANTNIDNRNEYSETGFATSFEIGYAPTNQFSINYLNNVNWASAEENYSTGAIDGASGFTALTVNYYINNSIDTVYVVGGIAAAGLDSEFETAGVVGIGYAMDNVEFEINGVFGKHNDDNLREIFFTVSYMFY